MEQLDASIPGSPPGHARAWACRRYGSPDVLALVERPLPRLRAGQLLVQVSACTVESADVRIRTMAMPRGMGLIGKLVFGWKAPRRPVLGSILAGTVRAVGKGVDAWAVGDAIVAATGMAMGAHADWVVLDARRAIVRRPARLAPAEAVSVVFGGLAAQHFLDRAQARAGERILVLGATGSVGAAIVQLARHRGLRVTGMSSRSNMALARSLGARRVIDYRAQPLHTLDAPCADLIADTCGATRFTECLPLLTPGGRYLAIAADLAGMLAPGRQGRRRISGTAPDSMEALGRVMALAEAGVLRPLIDARFGFEALPEAHARAGSGRKRGCVVVDVPG